MIDSGIKSLQALQQEQATRQRARTKLELYNKTFGLIKSIQGKPISDHNTFCGKLTTMTIEEQRQAILAEYGPVCLAKVENLLRQINEMK